MLEVPNEAADFTLALHKCSSQHIEWSERGEGLVTLYDEAGDETARNRVVESEPRGDYLILRLETGHELRVPSGGGDAGAMSSAAEGACPCGGAEPLFDYRGWALCEECWTELAWRDAGKPEPGQVVRCPL